ncbi:MAG TPA: serine hydrolase [Actinomycetota bacterium]
MSPELAERDERFGRITLRDLLTMSSGLRYEEPDIPVPWGDDVVTYYGVDLRDGGINGSQIVEPPRVTWHYNNYNPLLFGDGPRASHADVGLAVHGHQVVAADRRGK